MQNPNPSSHAHARIATFFWNGFAPILFALALLPGTSQAAPDFDELQQAYHRGEYEEVLKQTDEAITEGVYHQKWRQLKLQTELALGRHKAALTTLKSALSRHSTSIEIRQLAVNIYRLNGMSAEAQEAFDSIATLAKAAPWRYSDRESRVTLGRHFLRSGYDPKEVLDVFYKQVTKTQPNYAPVHLAIAELGVEKHDYAVAVDAIQKAYKLEPKNPDIAYLYARILAHTDDGEKAQQMLRQTIELNPRHAPSLLWMVEQAIDRERYGSAHELIERVLTTNPHLPAAWSYRAVLAHLQNQPELETAYAAVALLDYQNNPEVEHLIGRKLSQKYRFKEGAAYQRRALAHNAKYAAARIQLCQDLLRLGDEDEGWELATEIADEDGYNILAHNLTKLHAAISQFTTLEHHDDKSCDIYLRMEATEAAIYGDQALALLVRARDVLSERYDVTLDEPVIVEIFPRQDDFAMRTFGLPGSSGFLGVCFGRVITANSPAALGENRSNWQAVLWHEFCHVITLSKTNNKMPRWLSEGISVYEELEENSAWGQQMTPNYREMILGGELTPVSQLSGAFLNPRSGQHLQFAYYQSSLVVRFLIDKYGRNVLNRILVDLSVGLPINDALQRYVGTIEFLDLEFDDYAKQLAREYGGDSTWTRPTAKVAGDPAAFADWLKRNPRSYPGRLLKSQRLVGRREFEQAKPVLQDLIDDLPNYVQGDSPYRALATVHREQGNATEERRVLEELVKRDGDAEDELERLLELCTDSKDWEAVKQHAQSLVAINPLTKLPHRHLVDAGRARDEPHLMIDGLRAILKLGAIDPAAAHFDLAQALQRVGQAADAKRELLQALEHAPRYRAALKMLLQLSEQNKPKPEEENNDKPPASPVTADTAPSVERVEP